MFVIPPVASTVMLNVAPVPDPEVEEGDTFV